MIKHIYPKDSSNNILYKYKYEYLTYLHTIWNRDIYLEYVEREKGVGIR